MTMTTLLQRESITVFDYRCSATPYDQPFVESHSGYSISYVRKGSFGLRSRGRTFELVAGSIMVGYPGDEFICSHDHHLCGDECLSFQLAPEFIDSIGDCSRIWRISGAPPLAPLIVLGELAQAAAAGHSNVGLDEIGMLLAARFVALVSGQQQQRLRPGINDQRRAVQAALWIDAHAHQAIDLITVAKEVGLTAFHFLRVFANAWRDTASILVALPFASRCAFARKRYAGDHRYCIRCRICRSVEFRAQLSSRRRCFAAKFSLCRASKPQDFPRTFARLDLASSPSTANVASKSIIGNTDSA